MGLACLEVQAAYSQFTKFSIVSGFYKEERQQASNRLSILSYFIDFIFFFPSHLSLLFPQSEDVQDQVGREQERN